MDQGCPQVAQRGGLADQVLIGKRSNRRGSAEFEGVELTPPTETFDGQLDLQIGDHRVELIEVD